MRIKKLLRQSFKTSAVLFLLFFYLSVSTPQGITAFKTIFFIAQVIPNIPIKPSDIFVKDPIQEKISFQLNDRQGFADIYRPDDDERHAAVLLFLGVNPAGRTDQRVINLGKTLARSGMVVMIPWSDNMTNYVIEPSEVDDLISGYEYLLKQDFVDPEKTGLGGFCVGASLVTVAASDQTINDSVYFVNFFGGFFNAESLIVSVSSKTRYGKYGHQAWHPSNQAIITFEKQLINSLQSQDDRTRLLNFKETGSTNQLTNLSEDGNTIYKLLNNPNFKEAQRLVKTLSPTFTNNLSRISPSSHLKDLNGKLLIMHDASDNNIPPEESRRFFEAVKNQKDVTYTEFAFFNHMDPGREVSPLTWSKDIIKLFLHIYQVIRVTQ